MTSRPVWTRLVPAALTLLAALGGARASADTMSFHVDVNTSPPGVPAATLGSLEFQFASYLGTPPGFATLFNFTTDGTVVGPPTAFTGNVFGTLPPGPLTISETPTQSADILQDFNFGSHFSFDVTMSTPGAFSMFLWDDRGGSGNPLLSSPDPSAAGAALVISVDSNGTPTFLTGPGVSVPEPSSLALLALGAAGLLGRRLWRRRRPAPPPARRVPPGVELLEDRTAPAVSFLGVGAGDASSSDAILWTRTQDATGAGLSATLTAQVSTDPAFGTFLSYPAAGATQAAHDYTSHIDATGLQSGTRYFYRFVAQEGGTSGVGTFVTAPAPTAKVAVTSGFTGDADGLMRPYPATSSANFAPPGDPSFGTQNFDYFTWLGDTIYETASGAGTPNNSPAVGVPPVLADYWRKYREQFLPVSTGSYAGLTNFFDSTGHYTLIDNHELGNRDFINGGAPANAPFNTTDPQYDVNTTGTYKHSTSGFQVTEQAYTDYQPIRVATVSAPNDPRSNGTQQLYFAQQWGANSTFFNLDDRTNRDIRLRNAAGDDNGPRADNPGRTMLGATELAWAEQGLLAAQQAGVTWKFVAVSSPIDQIGPIGGSFTLYNTPGNTPNGATYSTTESDGGKSWMGGYRPERNALLKFIADNHIDHVVFLSTDDHQLRINELGYFTQFTTDALGFQTPVQSSYTRVPGTFEIVDGPIGATGPDGITDHSFANIQTLATNFATVQTSLGIDPIGLDPAFPGLKNVSREGDPNAGTSPSAFDFYSPDTFNYSILKTSADGSTFTVTIDGINSYPTNSFPQPATAGPVRQILSFQIGLEAVNVSVNQATATSGGTTTLSATLTDTTNPGPLANKSLVFSLGGKVVGTATTNSSGVATLPNVSIAGLGFLPGVNAGVVSVRFAGDAADLGGSGSAALVVQPASNVTSQVSVGRTGPVFSRAAKTSTVGLTVTDLASSPVLNGNFVVRLSNLTAGVTLQSASMVYQGRTVTLVITHDLAGNAFVNLPAFITQLGPRQALPSITLVFGNASNLRFNFTTDVFTDPVGG
jgi:3-phytase/alkaline phosphatase D